MMSTDGPRPEAGSFAVLYRHYEVSMKTMMLLFRRRAAGPSIDKDGWSCCHKPDPDAQMVKTGATDRAYASCFR